MTKNDLIKIAEMEGATIDKRWPKAKIAEVLGIVLDGDDNEPEAEPEADAGNVTIRVLPMGDNKISLGKGFIKDAEGRLQKQLAKRNDRMTLPRDIAEGLERKGFAEIV
jgi:hypothetical protein